MSLWTYIIPIIVLAFLIAIVKHISKYNFLGFNKDEVILSRFWNFSKKILPKHLIKEFWVETLQGKTTGFRIITLHYEITFRKDKVSREEFENFSKKNNITLKNHEIWHGGGLETLFESKN